MKETMERGTILVEDGTPMPESLLVYTEPYAAGWSSLENFTRRQLGESGTKSGGQWPISANGSFGRADSGPE